MDDTTLMAESKEELKSLLMKVKKESEKADLKLNIPKTKIMEYSPITINSWQIDEETMETVKDFIFLGSKIIAVGDCSYEIKTLAAPEHTSRTRHQRFKNNLREREKKKEKILSIRSIFFYCELLYLNDHK